MSKLIFSERAWEEYVYWQTQDKKNSVKDIMMIDEYYPKLFSMIAVIGNSFLRLINWFVGSQIKDAYIHTLPP